MSVTEPTISQFELDRQMTVENRDRLARNKNLLHWYEELYRQQFAGIADFSGKRVLEIGSGTSPAKRFYPHIMTSDVLPLDYLDFVFDCHRIDEFTGIADGSLDVVTLTNVLHHLQDPLLFLRKVATKLRPGGQVIATEPYFSTLSGLFWRYLHHEPVDFSITEPKLANIEGPLASSNQAMPFLIFKQRSDWVKQLHPYYEPDIALRPFSTLSYMATGGISRTIPLPAALYRSFFGLDAALATALPDWFAAFFTIVLRRSQLA